MCGIAGIIRPGASPSELEGQLAKMWPGIAARGPDGRGHLIATGVGLLHSRLAIIDLSTGDQPIWNERHTVGCVFNGEIYNYRSIRENLQASGHSLSTTSDTEVLVHLYEDYGAELVHRLRGMYAFAIWDRERERVILGRDRRGIKPLYLADVPGGGLAFSSTIRSLLALGVSSDPLPSAIAEYFRFGKVAEPRTAYRGVRTLLPGQTLSFDLQSREVKVRRFYSPTVRGNATALSACEAEANARHSFENAIRSHLVADVEVGAFLSGGIDSSLVVAQAQRFSDRPLRTYAVGFKGKAIYSETEFAERVASRLGTRHVTLELSSPPAELLHRALSATDQPFAVASFLPLLLLSERAAQDVKVVLTGDGGDEVGFGYNWYRWARWTIPPTFRPAVTRMSRGLRRAELAAGRHRLTRLRRAAKFTRGALLGGAEGADAWRYELTRDDSMLLLANEHRSTVSSECKGSAAERAWDNALSDTEAMRMDDLDRLLRDEMLPKLDRAGMAYGLEGRVPLLDDDFVDAMLALPVDAHMRDPRGKTLLRAWAADLCPDIDIVRPKHGFDVPIVDWLQASLYDDVKRLLLDRGRPGLVDSAAAKQTWHHMKKGIPGAAHAVFALLLAELWFEKLGATHE